MAGDGAGGTATVELATNDFVQAIPLESDVAGDASAMCCQSVDVMYL